MKNKLKKKIEDEIKKTSKKIVAETQKPKQDVDFVIVEYLISYFSKTEKFCRSLLKEYNRKAVSKENICSVSSADLVLQKDKPEKRYDNGLICLDF